LLLFLRDNVAKMKRLRGDDLARAIVIRDRISHGQTTFSRQWIVDAQVRVMAAENFMHFEETETIRFSNAFKAAGIQQLFAVTNDDDPHYVHHAAIIDPTPDDFEDVALTAFVGEFFVLFSQDERYAVLFSPTGDFKLIAGPRGFLLNIYPDLRAQRNKFIDFAHTQLSYPHTIGYELGMQRAIRYMDWLN